MSETNALGSAANRLKELGYNATKIDNHWQVTTSKGEPYRDRLTNKGLDTLANKLVGQKDSEDTPDPATSLPSDGTGEPVPPPGEDFELKVEKNGTVKASNIPLFNRNPELKRALAASGEDVTVDPEGNVHVGGLPIKDDAKLWASLPRRMADIDLEMREFGINPEAGDSFEQYLNCKRQELEGGSED